MRRNGTDYHARFHRPICTRVQDDDLTLGIRHDRCQRPTVPSAPVNRPTRTSYVHIKARKAGGIVISGTKAIVQPARPMCTNSW